MDDDQLDILRIEALKSALKKKSRKSSTSQNDNYPQEEEDNEEEKSLRELALKSCQKESSRKTKENASQIDNAQNETATANQNDNFANNNNNNVEELHLRERALKSLLKKRVVKTETIIKVFINFATSSFHFHFTFEEIPNK